LDDSVLFKKVDDLIKNDISHLISADGGRIKLLSVKDACAYVKLSGACYHCNAIEFTMKGVVERILLGTLPELKSVENVK
jgi:Fe-S cluster biogenesis protein NfuA